MFWKNMNVDLRFLSKPLYRYEVPDEGSSIVDGAVFAYAHKELDDPEVLLIIEAQRVGHEVRWHYALARLTDREAWVKCEGKEIWRTAADSAGIFDGVITKPYGVFIVKMIPRNRDGR